MIREFLMISNKNFAWKCYSVGENPQANFTLFKTKIRNADFSTNITLSEASSYPKSINKLRGRGGTVWGGQVGCRGGGAHRHAKVCATLSHIPSQTVQACPADCQWVLSLLSASVAYHVSPR